MKAMMGSMNEKPIRGGREPASKTLLCTGYGHANGSGGTCLHATVYGLMCEEYEAMRDRAGLLRAVPHAGIRDSARRARDRPL
jgi:hypothetical protein